MNTIQKKLLKKLVDLSCELEKNGHHLFFSWSPHVGNFGYSLFICGWSKRNNFDLYRIGVNDLDDLIDFIKKNNLLENKKWR